MERIGDGLLFFAIAVILTVTVAQSDSSFLFKNLYSNATNFTASVFFKDSVTAESLKKTFALADKEADKQAERETRVSSRRRGPEKIRVLVVPGHDAEFSGTVFGGLKEVELNLELGEKLYSLLKTEPAFEVFLTQTWVGYTPYFKKYFEENRSQILQFIETHKVAMQNFVNAGQVERVVHVEHNFAPSEVAIRLFGINKWANENGIDIVVHVHFNDYPGRKRGREGQYSGFSIYVPESQYSNAKGSKSVADSIYERLAKFYPQSNLPMEDRGIVEDQELIALGSNNTLDGAGVLIEYGYIYESAFSEPTLRNTAMSDLALQTFLGVMDFFGETPAENLTSVHETEYLPHQWNDNLKRGLEADPDVLRLQAALAVEGVYPPPGENKNSCSLTGNFGPCTERSVKAFQQKSSIAPAEGFVGEKTRAKLNELFGK